MLQKWIKTAHVGKREKDTRIVIWPHRNICLSNSQSFNIGNNHYLETIWFKPIKAVCQIVEFTVNKWWLCFDKTKKLKLGPASLEGKHSFDKSVLPGTCVCNRGQDFVARKKIPKNVLLWFFEIFSFWHAIFWKQGCSGNSLWVKGTHSPNKTFNLQNYGLNPQKLLCSHLWVVRWEETT